MIPRHKRVIRFLQVRMMEAAEYLEVSFQSDKEKFVAESLKDAAEKSETACLASCKWMYFCTLPRGHTGCHADGGLSWESSD